MNRTELEANLAVLRRGIASVLDQDFRDSLTVVVEELKRRIPNGLDVAGPVWDVIVEEGWAPEFCAGRVLESLRDENGPENAARYLLNLRALAEDDGVAVDVLEHLIDELTPEERATLGMRVDG